jgi:hypothetical protein
VRAKPRSPQRFVVSHHREDDFEGGLRTYAKYRDLGIADATNGMVRAHVIRFIPPCRPEEVSKRHYNDVEFQMIYVLKGWISPSINIFMPLFSIRYMSMGAMGWRCRNTVATRFSRSDPDDREALSSKTVPGVTQHPRNRAVGAPANQVVGSPLRRLGIPNRETRNQTIP